MPEKEKIIAKNKKASFEYFLEDRFIAGLVLTGSEIKSIRDGKVSITEAYCLFLKEDLVIRNMFIEEYSPATVFNHLPKRDRIILLKKTEIKKIRKKLKDQGVTLVPTLLFLSEKGWAKIEIAIAKGKKFYDKRDTLKQKEAKRQIDRASRAD